MARAWTLQGDKQVKKFGKAKASWYVGCIRPRRQTPVQELRPRPGR